MNNDAEGSKSSQSKCAWMWHRMKMNFMRKIEYPNLCKTVFRQLAGMRELWFALQRIPIIYIYLFQKGKFPWLYATQYMRERKLQSFARPNWYSRFFSPFNDCKYAENVVQSRFLWGQSDHPTNESIYFVFRMWSGKPCLRKYGQTEEMTGQISSFVR